MSHEIETHGSEAAFVSARVTPWHGLGTVVDQAMTAEEALKLAHLDWRVTKQPLYAHIGESHFENDSDREPEHQHKGSLLEVPDKFATVRTNPFTGELDALGVVGKDYTVVQNDENAPFLDALVGESGAHFETAGSLRGGRQVFITMKAPEGLLIGGQDAVDLNFVATNSHDGTSPFKVAVTPTRVVCANTLRAGLAGAKATFSTRHTRYATDRVAEAQKALGIMWDYSKHFQTEADKMVDTSLTDSEFERIVSHLDLFKPAKDETERQQRARLAQLDDVFKVYESSPTNATIAGTRWGGYNAVTEYLDWKYPVRGSETDRMERIATGGWLDKAKQDAYKAFAVK